MADLKDDGRADPPKLLPGCLAHYLLCSPRGAPDHRAGSRWRVTRAVPGRSDPSIGVCPTVRAPAARRPCRCRLRYRRHRGGCLRRPGLRRHPSTRSPWRGAMPPATTSRRAGPTGPPVRRRHRFWCRARRWRGADDHQRVELRRGGVGVGALCRQGPACAAGRRDNQRNDIGRLHCFDHGSDVRLAAVGPDDQADDAPGHRPGFAQLAQCSARLGVGRLFGGLRRGRAETLSYPLAQIGVDVG